MKPSGTDLVASLPERQTTCRRVAIAGTHPEGNSLGAQAVETGRSPHQYVVLELTVPNDPGVLAHVCSVFAWRRFHLHSMLCLPFNDGAQSQIWLRVADDSKLTQTIRQLEKLVHVHDVRCHGVECEVYRRMEILFAEQRPR